MRPVWVTIRSITRSRPAPATAIREATYGGPVPRLLTIMGSGETAPTMVKAHREVFTRLGLEAPDAVVLDTPYGFQTNADIVSDKAVAYFRESVGRRVSVAGLRRTDTAERVELERALAHVAAADWLFTGPGSPSFALRQWRGTPVPDVLARKLTEHGVLVFSSAAALTLGIVTVPVYEIYKVGADPYWLEGLDLLSRFGLPVAVIPHFDNTEGGNHDTRFCYLGLERLERLEPELPPDAFVLGVDEHTALVIDLDADTATILGRGGVTLRRGDRHRVLAAAGQTVPLDVLRAGPSDVPAPGTASAPPSGLSGPPDADTQEMASLAEVARRSAAAFDAAMGAGDADRALGAVLELDGAIAAWSADTFQSDEMDRARATLRAMIVRLAEAARDGLRDPHQVLGPLVEATLALRARVRAEGRYDLSDLVRDELAGAGVEVRDTSQGVTWELRVGS
jgi:cyanophycinase-like exopeptidase